ncbi:MAG: BMC domain-containing protein [Propionicimonas sp.]
MLSLGQIEVVGLPAAIEAADVALKAANVELIGYEATDGMGMVAVKIVGQVGAVKAAMAAAQVAAAKINKVFSVSIIARPNDQIEPIVYSKATIGRAAPTPEPAPEPQPPVEPVQATPVTPIKRTRPARAEGTNS